MGNSNGKDELFDAIRTTNSTAFMDSYGKGTWYCLASTDINWEKKSTAMFSHHYLFNPEKLEFKTLNFTLFEKPIKKPEGVDVGGEEEEEIRTRIRYDYLRGKMELVDCEKAKLVHWFEGKPYGANINGNPGNHWVIEYSPDLFSVVYCPQGKHLYIMSREPKFFETLYFRNLLQKYRSVKEIGSRLKTKSRVGQYGQKNTGLYVGKHILRWELGRE